MDGLSSPHPIELRIDIGVLALDAATATDPEALAAQVDVLAAQLEAGLVAEIAAAGGPALDRQARAALRRAVHRAARDAIRPPIRPAGD